ncbi:DUF1444 family protein [Sideroxydans lithotrophicus]|uniref:DUF1444 family protein n=1 Tax=Sideroxydans lithotrophicus (strain ES-1) TaxID=580332 RepID=D5CQW2_SIDLE|nr:DUF1444 family protein [Sideroxydans lithotrophicus]ADE11348.1 conserved hypothetical protein [Sideroxydans lithotrophicus ES-1]
MKRFLASLIFTLGLSSIATAAPLSADQFTKVFAKELKKAQPAINLTVKGDLLLIIKDPDGKETTTFLNNAYSQYLLDPTAVDEILKKYITSFVEATGKSAPLERTRIVPIIKDRNWIAEIKESVKQRGSKQAPENVYEDFNEELVILYAEDTPTNITYFAPKSLDEIGISRKQLRTLSVANLTRLIPKPQVDAGPLVSMITVGGNYEASLLLFDDLWTNLSKANGEIVVAVPARDLLMFTGSRNQQGLTKLRELATKYAKESPYHLTDKLFVYRNGHFARFE